MPLDVTREWIRRPDHVPDRPDQVHGSTVVECAEGLLAAWFRGPHEGHPDTRIEWSLHDGSHWSSPTAIFAEPGVPCWNPVVCVDPAGQVRLFFRIGAQISRWRTVHCTWTGSTFGPVLPVLAPIDGGPVKNPPVVLADGSWLAGGSVERWSDPPRWDAHVDRSDARPAAGHEPGTFWRRAGVPLDHDRVPGAGIIQPTLWQTSSGAVAALLRSDAGAVFRSVSTDGGRHWSAAVPIAVPNNNSGLCATALPDGRVLLAHNPVGEAWGPRCPLVLSVSDDDGVTFTEAAVLDDGREPVEENRPGHLHGALADTGTSGDTPARFLPADSGVVTSGAGEYSYPTVVAATAAHDCRTDPCDHPAAFISYTWQRRGIVLARVWSRPTRG